ncbi:hypothetical protein ACFOZ0_06520 [Streptomyces yaanensis]|uniref:Uncharacterized protein n=1 Tax=Streptomyces yaanensis TaxID=1142239 RepID=A0ABV7S9N0_9ACTN|nr:hypothetical protein [Streptomyces sp. CGMCC 4.7035]WNC02453.1 hypothetical protein Q2K21_32780 [Streptomyces sp. CGMCC 4.7035]
MSVWAPSGALASTVEITSDSVQRGDVIQVGGQPCRVSDLFQLPGGAKRLVFESGELLTMHRQTRLVAMRILRGRGGDPVHAFSPRRYRR